MNQQYQLVLKIIIPANYSNGWWSVQKKGITPYFHQILHHSHHKLQMLHQKLSSPAPTDISSIIATQCCFFILPFLIRFSWYFSNASQSNSLYQCTKDFPGISFIPVPPCTIGILQLWDKVIILKINIMKSTSYQNIRKDLNETTTLWDAFVNYLESTYFPGASEILDTKTICFEYEAFKSCYSN